MTTRHLALLAFALTAACGDSTPDVGATPDATATTDATATADAIADTTAVDSADTDTSDDRTIFPGLYRMDGLDPTLPDDDLAPLWDLVLDADVVGLGESVHTSGGFYATKERLVRDLVLGHGVRVLAMETPHTAATWLDRYLQEGPCDADPVAVFGAPHYPIFGVFVDDHTAALFRWLCEWNVAHADDRVRFFGFDAQQPSDDLDAFAAFLDAHAADRKEAAMASLAPCNSVYGEAYPAEDFAACNAAIDALEADLAASVEAQVPAHDWAELAIDLRSFRSWQGQAFYDVIDVRRSWESRDVAMADIFEARAALDFPGQRIALWAHNYHLAADHPHIAKTNFVANARTLGSELRLRRGRAYRPVAITAYHPGINWPGVSTGDGSTEQGQGDGDIEQAFFDDTDADQLIYDPRSEWAPPEAEWFLSEEKMIMRDNFDAIVWLRASPPMHAVLW